MLRLLITGGTGYLGRILSQQAQTKGWQVAASYYSQKPAENEAVTWLQLDIRDPQEVAAHCATFRPDVIIHTAFRQTDPDLWEVTAEGAKHVAQTAQTYGTRLIHLSSDVIFDGKTDVPYSEDAPPNPITVYGKAKAQAEYFVAMYHPKSVIIRTSLIYGFTPIDRHTQFVLDLATGRCNERLFRDEYRNPIFVEDLSAAIIELIQYYPHYKGVLNIAGSERLSRYEFGVLLAQAHGYDPTRIKSGLSAKHSPQRPRNCTLNIQLALYLLQTPLRGVHAVLADYQRPTT